MDYWYLGSIFRGLLTGVTIGYYPTGPADVRRLPRAARAATRAPAAPRADGMFEEYIFQHFSANQHLPGSDQPAGRSGTTTVRRRTTSSARRPCPSTPSARRCPRTCSRGSGARAAARPGARHAPWTSGRWCTARARRRGRSPAGLDEGVRSLCPPILVYT